MCECMYDEVNAGKGDDLIEGGEGNDLINGGEGFDQAIFSGDLSEYKINFLSEKIVVVITAVAKI